MAKGQNEYYTAREMADKLGVNIMTIYRYINGGKLKAYKFGKEFRVEQAEFDRFMREGKEEVATNNIVPQAIHTGVFKLGDIEIDCYVLDNNKRVISQRAFVKFLSSGRESGDLKRYLRAKSIENYLPARLHESKLERTLVKFAANGTLVHGLESTDIIDIANVYLLARQNDVLAANQLPIARAAEVLLGATAKTGIDAVIDEATGYEFYKRANDLQERLAAYLQEGYREWTRTFEREFFLQLYRLEGRKPPMPLKRYPQRFGRYVMRFVYDTLDPGVADWLRENNPEPAGEQHHWQKFNDFGYKRLQAHLMSVVGIMKASEAMDAFVINLARAFPNIRTQRAARLHAAKETKLIGAGQATIQFL